MSTPHPDRPTQRVRVTAPVAGRPRRRSVASEIDAQTELGEVFMIALMRSQLRLAVATVVVLALTIGLLPMAFLFPEVRRATLFGVPVPWAVLGVLVYPCLVLLAWRYVRRAERNERDFHNMVGPD